MITIRAIRTDALNALARRGESMNPSVVQDHLQDIDFNPAYVCTVEPSVLGKTYKVITMTSGLSYTIAAADVGQLKK